MRKLTYNELSNISGAATMTYSGNSIIFTLNAAEEWIEFNDIELNWNGHAHCFSGYLGGGATSVHQQGGVLNGYHIYYSMSPNGIAQYTLTAAGV